MSKINYSNTLESVKSLLDVQCVKSDDTGDLIMASTIAVKNSVQNLYLMPSCISLVWGWVEKTPLKLYADIEFNEKKPVKQLGLIKEYLNSGAGGIQIRVNVDYLSKLSNLIAPLRNEIFFNREFSIALKLDSIYQDLIPEIINELKTLHINKLSLIVNKKFDIIPWLFGFFQICPLDIDFEIEIFMEDTDIKQIEDSYRLANSLMKDFKSKIRFAVPFSFFKNYPEEIEEE